MKHTPWVPSSNRIEWRPLQFRIMIFISSKEWTHGAQSCRSCPIERNVHTYSISNCGQLIANIDDVLSLFPNEKDFNPAPVRVPSPLKSNCEIVPLTDVVNSRRWHDAASRTPIDCRPPSTVSSFNTFQPSFTNDQLSIWKNRRRRKKRNEQKKKREITQRFDTMLLATYCTNVPLEI